MDTTHPTNIADLQAFRLAQVKYQGHKSLEFTDDVEYAVCLFCTAYYWRNGLVCELDKTVGKTCILRSPITTFNWSCVIVRYEFSSDDVTMTADLLVDGVSNANYTLLDKHTSKTMLKAGLGSSVSLQLTASRYLVSAADYEFAFVNSVEFLDYCGQDTKTGMRNYIRNCICKP